MSVPFFPHARQSQILKRLSYITLAVSFAPLPLSFDDEEIRQEDALYDTLTLALANITTEVTSLAGERLRTPTDLGLRSFLQRVEQLCNTVLRLYNLREDLIELVVERGSANLRRLQSAQLEASPLASRAQPSSLSLRDPEGRSALWSLFLAQRAPPADAEATEALSNAATTATAAGRGATTQQLVPPGAINLLRAWEREVTEAVAEINVGRSAQQIAQDPLYVPLFDTASLETQTFTDDQGTRYKIQPTVQPEAVFPSLGHDAAGRDDHSLEGYNVLAARWAGEGRERNRRIGKEFWRVTRETK